MKLICAVNIPKAALHAKIFFMVLVGADLHDYKVNVHMHYSFFRRWLKKNHCILHKLTHAVSLHIFLIFKQGVMCAHESTLKLKCLIYNTIKYLVKGKHCN